MIHLMTVERNKNQHRFFYAEIIQNLFGQWGVQWRWGRVGQAGTLRVKWYETQEQAKVEAKELINKKVIDWAYESGIAGFKKGTKSAQSTLKIKKGIKVDQGSLSDPIGSRNVKS